MQAPARLRAGSPVRVAGRAPGFATLWLRDGSGRAPLKVSLGAAAPVDTPQGAAWAAEGHVTVVAGGLEAGARLVEACLDPLAGSSPGDVEGPRDCAPLDSFWGPGVSAAVLDLPAGPLSLGETLPITAADLLLPGEGVAQIEVQRDGGAAVTARLETSLSTGRSTASLAVAAAWMGVISGAHTLRWRLSQRAGGQVARGPWREGVRVLLPPEITAEEGAEAQGIRRGSRLPLRLRGVPPPGEEESWEASVEVPCGQGCGPDAPPRWLPLRSGWLAGRASLWLPSVEWFDGGWAGWSGGLSGPAPRLRGVLRLRLRGPGAEASTHAAVLDLPVRPTRQVIVVALGDSFELGLERFGLRARSAAIRAAVIAGVRAHFAGLRVTVGEAPPEGAVEYVRVEVLDTDPNGLGLLGVDSSPGKDVGNRFLGETLGGLSPAARVAGDAAWGGVFLSSFEAFSPKLRPGSGAADLRFDAIFGPFMPALGGSPASSGAASEEAARVLAHLVAGTISHEVGHTLGLPAAEGALHHRTDHAGWRMDAGDNRPFAERAGLPGASPEVWGPVDTAYLQAILGGTP